MKYLKRFNESHDDVDDDVVRKGFKYSDSYINQVMLYLTDVGFELDEENKEYFIDSKGERCQLEKAEKSVIELSFTKSVGYPTFYRGKDSGGYPSRTTYYHFTKWNSSVEDINDAISSFCHKFDDCYYHLSLLADKWYVKFVIYSDVEEEVRKKEKKDNLIHKIEVDISDRVSRIRRGLFDSFNKITYNKTVVNKLGENMWYPLGSLKKGCILIPVNTISSLPRTLQLTIMPEVNDRCRIFNNFLRGSGKAEVVTITEQVIDDLIKSTGDTKKRDYYIERYLGLTGIIMKFKYSKLFNAIKKEI